jgi:hypothetical protein
MNNYTLMNLLAASGCWRRQTLSLLKTETHTWHAGPVIIASSSSAHFQVIPFARTHPASTRQ